MKHTINIILLLISVLISGCSIVQVLFIEPKNESVTSVNENYTFENDTLKIVYGFWEKNGVMAFMVENKLEIPIYIDWKKSAFISSKSKFGYYEDIKTTKYSGTSESVSFFYKGALNWSTWFPATYSETEGIEVKTKEERVTFIPPHSVISRSSFKIYPSKYLMMDNIKKTKIENPKMNAKVVEFTKEISPLHFSNFITYSTKENFENEKYISNEFYVSKAVEIGGEKLKKLSSPKSFYVVFGN
jgi:hypothetical protein